MEGDVTTYYMDSKLGDDRRNDGLSEESPWQTLARLEEADLESEDLIKFRRGQVFHQHLILRQRIRRWWRRIRSC